MFLQSLRKSFVLERSIVVCLAASDFLSLLLVINEQPPDRFFVSFFSIRILFFVVTYIFSFVRLSRRFYIAGIAEMPVRIYWQLVSLTYFGIKALFLYRFIGISSPILQLVEFSFVVGVVGRILISYQTQPWAKEESEKRKKRINCLARKAQISKRELSAVTPILAEKGRLLQRKPVVWIATEIFIGTFIGATITAYSVQIVNWIQQVGMHFPNLLPPY